MAVEPKAPKEKAKSPATVTGFLIIVAMPVLVVIAAGWWSGAWRPAPVVALVTSTDSPYWDRVVMGARRAAEELGLRLEVVRCRGDEKEQSQAIRDLVARGVRGIAVSPVTPEGQAAMLSEVAGKTALVTVDSDAPEADRVAFVGTDNYLAGQECAQLVREALPDGGRVLISVGSVEKQNGRDRRQGLIDGLLRRPITDPAARAAAPPPATDPVDAELKGPEFTIVGTVVDGADPTKARTLVGEAVKRDPDINCVVGLFGYSTPAILAALKDAGMAGKVKVVGFDEAAETLAGIDDGTVVGTILQDQYNMGYDAVGAMYQAIMRGKGVKAVARRQYVPARAVRDKEDVKVLRFERERQTRAGAKGAPAAATTRQGG